MRKLSFLIVLIWLSVADGLAQTAQQADELFQQKSYAEAFSAYESLINRQPKSMLFRYRYARCAQQTGQRKLAIEQFLLAGERYPLRNYYLAELYQDDYQFALAKEYYEKYLKSIDESNDNYSYVIRQLGLCNKGIRYLKRVEDVAIVDSLLLSKSDIIGAFHLSEEAGVLSESGGCMVHTNQRGDRRVTACRRDSIFNLMICQKLSDAFSECDTLRDINTGFNDNYPFLLSDGITLYFASDREEGLGGYDIYMTRYNSVSDAYLSPENIGMPFNSPANDYMLCIDETRNLGYFLTDRRQAPDSVVLYTFVPNATTKVLRDKDETYVRKAAQLLTYRKENSPQVAVTQTVQEPKNAVQEKTIFFILKDTVAYRKMSDFRSIDARRLYEDFLEMEQQHRQQRTDLAGLRRQYAASAASDRQQLRTQILQLEQLCSKHKAEETAALNKVRLVEIKTY